MCLWRPPCVATNDICMCRLWPRRVLALSIFCTACCHGTIDNVTRHPAGLFARCPFPCTCPAVRCSWCARTPRISCCMVYFGLPQHENVPLLLSTVISCLPPSLPACLEMRMLRYMLCTTVVDRSGGRRVFGHFGDELRYVHRSRWRYALRAQRRGLGRQRVRRGGDVGG